MLDEAGVCRWVVAARTAGSSKRTTTFTQEAESERCVGAQYVASVDTRVQGGLIDLPRVGSPLVFATVDASGRISLLRTGALLRFEVKATPDSGVYERPTPSGLLASAHSLPTQDVADADDDEPELKTKQFRPAEAMRGMLPPRSSRPRAPSSLPPPSEQPPRSSLLSAAGYFEGDRPTPRLPSMAAPIPPPMSLRGSRPGKLPPPLPTPPRREPSTGRDAYLPPPSPPTVRSHAGDAPSKMGGPAPRQEDEMRKVPVPASYWPGRAAGRTRRQA